METTVSTQALIWMITGGIYATIIVIVISLATRKISKLRGQLAARVGYGPIDSTKMLLQRISKELTPADFAIVIKAANSLPVVMQNGEFSYIKGLEKVIFTEMPAK